MYEEPTYKVRHVEAIGETTGGSMRCRINSIRVRVGTSSGGEVVVVAVVNERITENKKCSCLSFWSNIAPGGDDQQTCKYRQ